MEETSPLIYWIRRDLRLTDHPGLDAARQSGRPVIPVFILDPETEGIGAAPKWRLGLGIDAFRTRLEEIDSGLVLRRGKALDVLRALVEETGAGAVHWTRLYDPAAIKRDTAVKEALREDGVEAESRPGHVLFEPWTVETKSGGDYYKVYSPFWRAVDGIDVGPCLERIEDLPAPEKWPVSDAMEDWSLGAAMQRGAEVVLPHVCVGEDAARGRLERFLDDAVLDYAGDRDRLDLDGTSGLSENFTYGELSVREAWHAAGRHMNGQSKGPGTFRKEIAWREFAYHLIYHTPHLVERPWREEWTDFPWREDSEDAERWRRGMTGETVVDAAMRELFITGRMHNRARMIVASYLTKHLMTDWRVGMDWFADCLIDWDPASNALGWQWTAGCGPDAAPFFRVFNPETQGEKYDPDGAYRRRYLLGFDGSEDEVAASYFDAVPRSWDLDRDTPAPERMVGLKEGRTRALDAYSAFKDEH
ncbi:cryptochrome/photolyase family protein [Amaricoccus macauensis]|uniref:cryptochrome/photolyase family protein n=1 Tax=Amaricoccus macauensis TaxID=57001 RepID=UPI003C7DFDD6